MNDFLEELYSVEEPNDDGVCRTIKATPDRLEIIIALGCVSDGIATAGKLETILGIPMSRISIAIGGLVLSGVVDYTDAEGFYLSEKGAAMFDAIYHATGAVLRG